MFTTACFRECRTKQNPPAKRNETHLPKEMKLTFQKKRNPPASDASGLDSRATSRRCQAQALPWLLETVL